ncbi:Cof-type HAD-IIB family hydrolase [Paenibacillus sp. MMS18-CY102]|uniref:Cof-type HAD-IIB family hydrolase n=1 Tax=Paenibacillus sp. MMS18-CY102 TaxID=2682849 RepID=UPI0013656864|nr:Cof-type HAD-IIB family hydrolase [Paenibacillus sp. MMS18-CY102]MWC31370.1 Cof-type HAD-IIB family hydrolase [Paenibacillus sp. MMS18-CY102]
MESVKGIQSNCLRFDCIKELIITHALQNCFFDVDGTLTHDADGSISESTREAIGTLISKGIRVVAATGRPFSMCEVLQELGIETFITANGAYVMHNNEVIHKVAMDPHTVREITAFAQTNRHGLSFYTDSYWTNGVQDEMMGQALQETLSIHAAPAVHEDICSQEIYLLCLFATDEVAERYLTAFPHLIFRRWHPYVLSVLQEEVSKSLAISEVLRYFGIDRSEAIAFGDGDNDIDMLELAGLGIAMGNGSEKAKRAADFITKKSSEDGIAYALHKYGVI